MRKSKILITKKIIQKNKKLILFAIAIFVTTLISILAVKNSNKKADNIILQDAPRVTNYIYQNNSKDFKIYLGNRLDEKSTKIKFSTSGSSIEFSLANNVSNDKIKFEKKDEKTVIYKNVYPGIDLIYTLIEKGVKEEIKLNSPESVQNLDKVLTFALNLNKVVPKKDLQGKITSTFIDPTSGEYRFHFEKPFMIDAGNNRSNNIPLTITSSSTLSQKSQPIQYYAHFNPDVNWLKTALYPVIIDPTIVHDEQSDFTSGQLNRVKDVGNFVTGGTITYSEGYTIHTFTSDGTFTTNIPLKVDVLIVAGGGGGGHHTNNTGGGGGAGGLLYETDHDVTRGSELTVTVGAGGGGGDDAAGTKGDNSVFDNITAEGGGAGSYGDGGAGGSGGGAGNAGTRTGGAGNAGPPRQGYNGGNGITDTDWRLFAAGGGGGAGAVGANAAKGAGGDGGVGVDMSSYFGTSVGVSGWFAGGGGGSAFTGPPGTLGTGGQGGGGDGYRYGNSADTNGVANTGGGGGGNGGGNPGTKGGDGGSGIVIVRYPTIDTGPSIELYEQESPADLHTVGLWHMNETVNDSCSEGQDACDSSGNGNHGTATGTTITTTTQKLGAAGRSFNGSSDYILLPASSSFDLQNLSIEAWVYSDNFNRNMFIFEKTTNGSVNTQYSCFFAATDTFYFRTYNTSSNSDNLSFTTSSYFKNNQWNHVACTYNGSTKAVYVNGTLAASKSYSQTLITNPAGTSIIGAHGSGSYFFNGTIDEVRISNTARTPEEIKLDAQKRPYGVYTSQSIDLGTSVASLDSLQWTESITPPSTPDGWTKVKPVIIDNSQNSNTLTNYQVKLTVPYNSNMQSDFDDLKFTNSAGTNLDYWIEEKSDGVEAEVWVEVDSITASSKTTIFMWYGNSGASAGSDGGATFEFFDDFLGDSIDTTKWTITDGTGFSVSGGYLHGTNTTGRLTSISTFSSGIIQEIKAKSTSLATNGQMIGGFYLSSSNSIGWLNHPGNAYYRNDSSWMNKDDETPANNMLYTIKVKDSSTVNLNMYNLDLNSTYWNVGDLTNTVSSEPIALGRRYDSDSYNGQSYTTDWDRIIVRKYTSPEPTAGLGADIEFQTRTSANNSTWEEWKPISNETTILSMDSDATNWSTSNSNTLTKTDESTIKMEGNGSLKSTVGAPQVDGNTVALWHMEETSGTGAYIKDATANVNHGTPTGTTVVDGFYGKARSFNGSSDIITVGTTNRPTNTFTFSAWFTANSTHEIDAESTTSTTGISGQKYLFGAVNEGTNSGAGVSVGTNGISVYEHGSAYMPPLAVYNGTVPSGWNYLAIVYNNKTPSIYLNGTLVRTGLTSPKTTVYAPYQIGGGSYGYHDGQVDEVRISNVARTAEEIAEAYRAGKDHRLSRTLTSTDLSSKNKAPFYVAANRPGTYLETYVGETDHSVYGSDASTVSLWHLDEKSGSGAYIKDSSSNGNHGTPTGTTFTQGKIGKARSFASDSDYINVPDSASLDITGNLSIELWVKISSHSTYEYLISKGTSLGSYFIRISSGGGDDFEFFIYDGSSYEPRVNSNVTPNIGEWYHVAGTYNGTTLSIYVNGELKNTASRSVTIATNDNPLTIGASQFKGTIDEVRISNTTTRSADEIRQAYQYGLRTHQISVDYATTAGSDGPTSTSNYEFTPDSVTGLYTGDTVIIRENVDGTTYIMQGEVTSISSGLVTVSSWSGTAPSSGYSTNADVFKWQREYWDITDISTDDRDEITKLGIRVLDGSEGFDMYLDDFRSNSTYMTDPTGSTISSTPQRYFQYRAILTTNDTTVSPSLTSVTLNYTENQTPTAPTSLLTEGQTNPSQVPDTEPEFSAIYNDPDSDDIANKYRIQVDDDSEFGSPIWDSGASGTSMTNCNQGTRCADISYAGSALTGGITYYWRIKFFDDDCAESPWSTGTNTFSVNYTPLAPTSLLTEGQTNPTGVTDTTPEFSAIYNDTDTGDIADYYQIQVDDDSAFGSTLWDSDKTSLSPTCTAGDRCTDISYGGASTDLQWGATYYWRIKYWDDGGEEGAWSTESAYFTMSQIYAPTGCMIDDGSQPNQTIVKWNDNTSLETGYRVERSVDGGAYTLLTTEDADSTSSTDNTTSSEYTYQYRIRANSDNGNSEWCGTLTVDYSQGNINFSGVSVSGVTIK